MRTAALDLAMADIVRSSSLDIMYDILRTELIGGELNSSAVACKTHNSRSMPAQGVHAQPPLLGMQPLNALNAALRT